MPENENENTVEPNTQQEPQPIVKPRRAAKRVPVRTLEELDNAAIRSMSDTEKTKYIEHLKDSRVILQSKYDMLDQNCRGAFDQFRKVQQDLSEYKMKAQAKLQFARQAVQVCANSIILAGGLED